MNVLEQMKLIEDSVVSQTKDKNSTQVEDLLDLAQIIENGLTGFEIPIPDHGRDAATFLTAVAIRNWLTAFELAVKGQYNASLNILRLVALQTMLANYYGIRPRKAKVYMEGPRPDRLRRMVGKLQKTIGNRPSLRKRLEKVLGLIEQGLAPFAQDIIEDNQSKLIAASGNKPLVKALLKELKRGDTPQFKRLERLLRAEELDQMILKPLHLDVHARFFHVMEAIKIAEDRVDWRPHYKEEGWSFCTVRLLFYSWKLMALLIALIPEGEGATQWKKRAQEAHNRALDRFAQTKGFSAS